MRKTSGMYDVGYLGQCTSVCRVAELGWGLDTSCPLTTYCLKCLSVPHSAIMWTCSCTVGLCWSREWKGRVINVHREKQWRWTWSDAETEMTGFEQRGMNQLVIVFVNLKLNYEIIFNHVLPSLLFILFLFFRGLAGCRDEGREFVSSEVFSVPQFYLSTPNWPPHTHPKPVLWRRQRPLQPQPR